MEPHADIAVVGLAVMGQNLILNMNDHGFTVVAYNRTVSKVDEFLAQEARGKKVVGAHSLAEMAALLKRPRRVMLMIKAGRAVDDLIDQLLTVLDHHPARFQRIQEIIDLFVLAPHRFTLIARIVPLDPAGRRRAGQNKDYSDDHRDDGHVDPPRGQAA